MGIPSSLSQDEFVRRIEAFGFDPALVREFHVYPGGITVTMYRTDSEGRRYLGPNNAPATETFDIGIERPQFVETFNRAHPDRRKYAKRAS